MKKFWILLLAALTLTLTACGGGEPDKDSGAENADIALDSFYAGLDHEYGWGESMTDIEGEMLESYYPGLGAINLKQLVAKMPLMSSVVNEFVFLQCETDEDAVKAAEILQNRIDYQVGDENNPGGAWYPESIEAWKKGEVIQQGTYVAMIASAEHQADITEAFSAQFA